MTGKKIIYYSIIFILVLLIFWQWISRGSIEAGFARQSAEMQKDLADLRLLSGIGELRSAHLHADIKVYIDGKPIDFSQRKYQLASRFLHFEEGIGDVIHTHATGLTLGHLFKSLGMELSNNCLVLEGKSNCNDGDKKLKLYVNGQPSAEFDSRVIKNLDKYLVSYGSEDESQIQNQLKSITNLAPKYSLQK